MNVLSVCDGVATGLQALKELDIKVDNYYSSEIDEHPKMIAKKNHPEIIELGDLYKWMDWELPKIDLFLAGTECQDLSLLKDGGKVGLNGEKSKIFFQAYLVMKKLQPKYFLFENVRMLEKNEKTITELLGVEPIRINSDLFVPQNRPRLYWTNIPHDKIINTLPQRPDWDYKFYQFRRTYWRENKSGVCPCLTKNMGTGGNNVPYILEDGEKRVLTCEELEKLQGLPIGYTSGLAMSNRRKVIGNGWTLPTIKHILSVLKEGDLK